MPDATKPTFSIKNFDEFQHYRDRTPPWIKFYNSVLEDYEIASLPDATKAHLFAIWLLASRSGNSLPYDSAFIGNKINATEPVDLEALEQSGFIILDQGCSDPLSETEQSADTEGEREREQRESEREREKPPPNKKNEIEFPQYLARPGDQESYEIIVKKVYLHCAENGAGPDEAEELILGFRNGDQHSRDEVFRIWDTIKKPAPKEGNGLDIPPFLQRAAT